MPHMDADAYSSRRSVYRDTETGKLWVYTYFMNVTPMEFWLKNPTSSDEDRSVNILPLKYAGEWEDGRFVPREDS